MILFIQDKGERRDLSDYLAGIFESLPAALVLLDTRLRIVMVNAAAETLIGYPRAELVRKRLSYVMNTANIRYISRVLRERGKFQADGFITKLKSKHNKSLPVRLVVAPLRGSKGSLMGFLAVFSDLRTLRRIHGKLLEAERHEALSEIAVGLSHAINNPLCAIMGNTQLLLMESDKLDSSTVRKLKSIEREIARIQKIAMRLPRITNPKSKVYVGRRKMLDVEASLPYAGPVRRKRGH